jgi:hypothetical protein
MIRYLAAMALCSALAAGCSPAVAYFTPTAPAGKAEVKPGGGLDFKPAEGVRITLAPCSAMVRTDPADREFTLVIVEVLVANNSAAPVTVKAEEASLKQFYATGLRPVRIDRERGEAAAAVPAGGVDAWRIHFDAGGPEAMERLAGFQFSVPVAAGDAAQTLTADYRRYEPQAYTSYYYRPAYGTPYLVYEPYWYNPFWVGVGLSTFWRPWGFGHSHWRTGMGFWIR